MAGFENVRYVRSRRWPSGLDGESEIISMQF
jgi:hypothetical protein